MNNNALLPIGSVVLLKNGQKKLMVIGVMQYGRDKDNNLIKYDYVGVIYPEGFITLEALCLFNSEDIANNCFRGYEDEERQTLMEKLMSFSQDPLSTNNGNELNSFD